MSVVRLQELPPPPSGRAGWPWDTAAGPLPPTMPDSSPWPRISIVTPSFRQAPFLEETLRSVLLQGYPNLQYVVMDGGSTDGSVEIIKRYAPWLDHWVSERDGGQSDALRKGFARATGDIFAWVNSDDLLLPGALAAVAEAWRREPGTLIAGPVVWFEHISGAETLRCQRGLSFGQMVRHWSRECEFHQPGVFFPRDAYLAAGGVNESFRYAMDYDLFCRILRHTRATLVPEPLARFRYHATSKTGAEGDLFLLERHRSSQHYWAALGSVDEAAAERFMGRTLARYAVRRLAARDWRRGVALGREALAYAPSAAIAESCLVPLKYLARRLPGRRQITGGV